MKLLDVLLVKLGLRRRAGTRSFELDAPLHAVVSDLAEKEQRLPEEVASNLMAAGLAQRQTHEELVRCWESLSAREQAVWKALCSRQASVKQSSGMDGTIQGQGVSLLLSPLNTRAGHGAPALVIP